MARINSIIKLEGTLEGLTFVRSKDGLVVRRKSSLNDERIKTDPAFANFRKASTEFGHCSTISRHLRKALEPLLTGMSGRDMHNRLLPYLQKIQFLDTQSSKGERKVYQGLYTQEGQSLWKQFTFIGKNDFQNTFSNNLKINPTAGTITLPSWSSDTFQHPPKAATHIQLQLAWLDYHFEGEATPAIIQSTPIHPLHQSAPFQTLSFAIPSSSSGIITIYISTHYFQEVQGVYHPLNHQSGRMVGVVGVSVI